MGIGDDEMMSTGIWIPGWLLTKRVIFTRVSNGRFSRAWRWSSSADGFHGRSTGWNDLRLQSSNSWKESTFPQWVHAWRSHRGREIYPWYRNGYNAVIYTQHRWFNLLAWGTMVVGVIRQQRRRRAAWEMIVVVVMMPEWGGFRSSSGGHGVTVTSR